MTRCLIVDGSSVVRRVARRILMTPQNNVMEAENGKAALGALAGGAPDVVLVDEDLPDIEVTEFIRQVRAMRGIEQPMIIVMMTEMNLALMTKAKRAGADDYLLKPFDRDQLTRALGNLRKAA